jgi:hypothetical protein
MHLFVNGFANDISLWFLMWLIFSSNWPIITLLNGPLVRHVHTLCSCIPNQNGPNLMTFFVYNYMNGLKPIVFNCWQIDNDISWFKDKILFNKINKCIATMRMEEVFVPKEYGMEMISQYIWSLIGSMCFHFCFPFWLNCFGLLLSYIYWCFYSCIFLTFGLELFMACVCYML